MGYGGTTSMNISKPYLLLEKNSDNAINCRVRFNEASWEIP